MNSITTSSLKLNPNIIKKYSSNISNFENKKVVGYTYGILTLIAISFFGLFAIRPTLSTISTLQKQYEDDKIVDAALDKKLNALNQLHTQYQKISPSLENIHLAVPASSKAPYLLRQIQNISQKNNTTILKIEMGNTKIYPQQSNNAQLNSYTFNLLNRGKEEEVKNFINNLLNFERIVSIDSISITPSIMEDNTESNGNLDISFNGKVYFDIYEK